MTDRDLSRRLVASHSDVDGRKLFMPKTHRPTNREVQAIGRSARTLSETKIELRPNTFVTVEEIRADAQAMAAQDGGLGLLCVDYLQLADTEQKSETRAERFAKISRTLRGVSMELDVPVICLTQLNDQGRISDSRAIGKDAEVYLTIESDGVLVAKNRNGERDVTLPLFLDGPHFRFYERP